MGEGMKKILIGSIVSVAILISLSFTSVVGYRHVESNLKDSPLFNIRSNRAIGEQNSGLTNSYLGIENEINIHFPNRDKNSTLIQNFFKLIQRMDENEINNLIDSLKKYITKNKLTQNNNINKKSDLIKQLTNTENNQKPFNTFNFECFTFNEPITYCFFIYLVVLLVFGPIIMVEIISGIMGGIALIFIVLVSMSPNHDCSTVFCPI